MEELTLQHIEGVAYHRGDKDIEKLVQEYREAMEHIRVLESEAMVRLERHEVMIERHESLLAKVMTYVEALNKSLKIQADSVYQAKSRRQAGVDDRGASEIIWWQEFEYQQRLKAQLDEDFKIAEVHE